MKSFCVFIILFVFGSKCSSLSELSEFIKWQQIEFENLPDEGNFRFVQYNNVPQGFAVYKDKVFVAIPRRNEGVPSTLNYVKLDGNDSYTNPKLYSYPSFAMNELDPLHEKHSDRIVSVYRPRVDECDRLWFVDSGIINTSGTPVTIQPPSIWVIDLKNDSILKRYEIPEHVARDGAGLASITIDVIDCDRETFAYMPDLQYSQLLIYSLHDDKAYRMQHNYFHMHPFEGDYNVDGLKFSWNDGIFSVALTNGTAYFHPMSSFSEFSVSTRVLRNETLATRSNHEQDVKLEGNRGKDSQSTMHSFHHKTGVAYFAQINKNAVWCWNRSKALKPANVHPVAGDDVKLIYPADLTVVGDDLWVLSNRMIRHIYTSLDVNDFNFRIFRQSVKDNRCDSVRAYRRKLRG